MDNNDGFSQDDLDRAAAAQRRERDYNDQQHEIAGADNGRQSRFLGAGRGRGASEQDKKGARSARLSALEMLLLNDPEYARIHEEVSDLLSAAEIATDQALQNAERDAGEAQNALDETTQAANRLPDGTAIFKDANGQVWSEDGRLIEGEALEGVVWKEGAPGYEEFRARTQALEEARRRVEELRRYQTDALGEARNRLNDRDSPPSKEELKDIIKGIEEEMPDVVREVIQAQKAALEHDQTGPIILPKLT